MHFSPFNTRALEIPPDPETRILNVKAKGADSLS